MHFRHFLVRNFTLVPRKLKIFSVTQYDQIGQNFDILAKNFWPWANFLGEFIYSWTNFFSDLGEFFQTIVSHLTQVVVVLLVQGTPAGLNKPNTRKPSWLKPISRLLNFFVDFGIRTLRLFLDKLTEHC